MMAAVVVVSGRTVDAFFPELSCEAITLHLQMARQSVLLLLLLLLFMFVLSSMHLSSSLLSAVAACRVRPPLSLSLIHSLRLLVYLCQNQSDGIHQLFSGGGGGGDYHCSSALSSVADVAVVITSANRTH